MKTDKTKLRVGQGYIKGNRSRATDVTNGYDPADNTPYFEDMPVYMSEKAKPGAPVVVQENFLSFSNGVYMHPIDYYWYKWGDVDVEFTARLTATWRENYIERLAMEACQRIDEMVDSMQLKAMFRSSLIAVEHAKQGDPTLSMAFVQGAKAA